MSSLFSPITLRSLTVRNRVWVSPMCQYSAVDGVPTDWHLPHLGAFATGGVGLVLSEATSVTSEGRISPEDTGLWNDAQVNAWEPIARFVHSQGAAFGIQLAHAGRKASTYAPWRGRDSVAVADGGWQTIAPSAVAFGAFAVPVEMGDDMLSAVRQGFADAAARADAIGCDTVEVHAAHGYLLHEFLSPLSNVRSDAYGGSLDNRMRFPLECISAVRNAFPEHKPVLLRISATDWVDGGWDVEQSTVFAGRAKELGIDLVDVSSGGLDPRQQIAVGPGYQVPFAEAVRNGAGIPTGAVGVITEPQQAEDVVAQGKADVVLLARALLREPRWALRAAHELGANVDWPVQFDRARWS